MLWLLWYDNPFISIYGIWWISNWILGWGAEGGKDIGGKIIIVPCVAGSFFCKQLLFLAHFELFPCVLRIVEIMFLEFQVFKTFRVNILNHSIISLWCVEAYNLLPNASLEIDEQCDGNGWSLYISQGARHNHCFSGLITVCICYVLVIGAHLEYRKVVYLRVRLF